MEVLILGQSRTTIGSRQSWDVHLEQRVTGKRSESFILHDPFDLHDYNELKWYLEEYAANDPYALHRAQASSRAQSRYGCSLAASLEPYIKSLLNLGVLGQAAPKQFVHVVVQGNGTRSSLHGLHWELLECNGIFDSIFSYFVSRQSEIEAPTQLALRSLDDNDIFNILYVSARPGLEGDVSYCAISRNIMELLKHSAEQHRIRLRFSRPGTWRKFVAMLTAPNGPVYDLVHFDMHGSTVRSQGQTKAVLHFARAGSASKKPDRRTADSIAELLTRCKVRFAVLNACNSATTASSASSNLAYNLASCGVEHVAAMTFQVKTDAAALAMTSIYQALLQSPQDFVKAVRIARTRMAMNSVRTARFGLQVLCRDDFNLVLYSAKDTLCHQPLLKQTLQEDPATLSIFTGENNANITRIQDLDTLSLENALEASELIFMSGESGTGKSTLAKHLWRWWDDTFFAQEVLYIDSKDEFFRTQSTHKEEDTATVVDLNWRDDRNNPIKSQCNHDQIILLDNVESFDDWPQDPKRPKKPVVLEQMINELLISSRKPRVVIFTRSPLETLMSSVPSMTQLDISLPSFEEAVSLLRSLTPEEAIGKTLENAAEIKDLLEDHNMNLTFITTFLPYLAKSNCSPYQFVDSLLETPSVCSEIFQSLFLEAQSTPAFQLASERIASWPMKTDLARRLIFALSMFQQRMPKDARPWLYKLLEIGAFFPTLEPFVKPLAAETGKIHEWNLGDGWDSFASGWTFEESFFKVSDCLTTLGFWKNESNSAGKDAFYAIHPLLPYFLRSEIAKHDFKDLRKYQLKLEQGFWESYENYVSDRLSDWDILTGGDRVHIIADVQSEKSNLFQAIRLGLKQPTFPFRYMNSYIFASILNFLLMTKPCVQRWERLFGDVHRRYEQIVRNNQWSAGEACDIIPPKERRVLVFTSAINIVQQRGRALVELGDGEAVIANAESAIALRELFASQVDLDSRTIDQTLYCIDVQKGKSIPISRCDAVDLDTLAEILASPIPDNSLDIGGDRCKLARAELASHLLFESASIPKGHNLNDLVQKYSQELDHRMNAIYTAHAGLGQLGTLASRDLFIHGGDSNDTAVEDFANDYTTRTFAAEMSQRLQHSFESRTPSSSSGYYKDAMMYAADPHAIQRGDWYIFDRSRLHKVYEKAQEVHFRDLETFCLKQLAILAEIDGDSSAADLYTRELNTIGVKDFQPRALVIEMTTRVEHDMVPSK